MDAILVEVRRGGQPESRHHVAAVAVDATGRGLGQWGDGGLVTFPRSALKPFQALLLVRSGAMARLGLDDRHLALACGSHAGEAMHLDLVADWLARLGLDADALSCGPAWPLDEAARLARIRAGLGPDRICHNCSGKHCGFLSACQARGWDVAGYDAPFHPAQAAYVAILTEALGADAGALHWGIDGCTLPAPALSLQAMALATARLAAGRLAGGAEVQAAMIAHPDLMSGSTLPAVAVARATQGRVWMKVGAEGYAIAGDSQRGLGLALKVLDGAERARMPALVPALAAAGMISAAEAAGLSPLARSPITDSTGRVVGDIGQS